MGSGSRVVKVLEVSGSQTQVVDLVELFHTSADVGGASCPPDKVAPFFSVVGLSFDPTGSFLVSS